MLENWVVIRNQNQLTESIFTKIQLFYLTFLFIVVVETEKFFSPSKFVDLNCLFVFAYEKTTKFFYMEIFSIYLILEKMVVKLC